MQLNGLGSSSTKFRLSGMASGMDTDQMIKDLMKAESAPLYKLQKNKQVAEWKRDDYRSISNLLLGLKRDFLDYTKPANNMLSQSTLKKYTTSAVDSTTGLASSIVSVTGSADAKPGTSTVIVNRIATASEAISRETITGGIADFAAVNGKDFNITIDGVTKNISFTQNYGSAAELAAAIQSKLDSTVTGFGSGRVVVGETGGKLTISTAGATRALSISAGSIDALGVAGLNITPTTVNPGITKPLQSSTAITAAKISSINTGDAKKINVSIDGTTKEIQLGTTYTDASEIAADLNTKIATAFGAGKVSVSESGGLLTIDTINQGVGRVRLTSGNSNDGLSYLGFNSGDSNRINAGDSLANISSKFATPLTLSGGAAAITGSTSVNTSNFSNFFDEVSGKGKNFTLDIDGSTYNFEFTSDPTDIDDLVSDLQSMINAKVPGKVTVGLSGGKLALTRDPSVKYMAAYSGASDTSINRDALADLGISSGAIIQSQMKFTINSKEFTFNATDSLTSVINTVNNDAEIKVRMAYDETADRIKLTSTQLGAGNNITVSDGVGNNFFSGAAKIDTSNPVTTQGVDAEVIIDNQLLVRNQNSVTVNGVNYTFLKADPGKEQRVSLGIDADAVFKNIKSFVDKYNEMLVTINTKLSEKYDRNYQPLTAEEKKAMSEEDVKAWETKAKTGLLRNDSALQNVVYKMRTALTESVAGVGISLSSIGITTGNYSERGILHIDEEKVKEAINKDPDAVMNLFAKKPSVSWSRNNTPQERSTRYAEGGLSSRLLDIIEDNTSIYRDSQGNKGILVQKAGLVGDSSEFKNAIYDQMTDYDKRMDTLVDKLVDKENAYYKKFAAMEKMLSQMNSQSNWLASQLR